ncbi:CerR family C-terminal domain-containing protein [Maridesulfovibrio ferrireducens]|uniref:CerR family C-terminal domain-containing protein n=1 Tax=Maridesulfovibrio ferrireducens TaxID=246191 RepID=UPI001A30C7DC|nr:CerR family C-terminal domain-containing protein [Maridesulfovibrio ferrireducens]MBI9112448.1 CerR family C-terminal domain-containing protein [Maridesulfovibrio ferrireducens]
MADISKGPKNKKSRGEETRQRLLLVGARLFALNGFRGVSMRNLAMEAEINLATVGYHFGGKLGLYEAILQSMIERRSEIFPSLEEVRERVDMVKQNKFTKSDLVKWYFGFFIRRSAGSQETMWAALIITRELAAPSELYPMLDEYLFTPTFESLGELLAVAMESQVSEEERLIVGTALMGMVLKFVNPKVLMTRLGWDEYTPENIEIITEVLCRRAVSFVGCQE